MPATVTLRERRKMGNAYMNVCDIIPGVYATGGVSVTPGQFGLTMLDMVLPAPAAGYIFEYDHVNRKLKAFTPTSVAMAGTAGVAGADNTLIKTSDTAVGVSGTGTAAAVRNVAAEVANAVSLAAITTRVIAIGI